MGDEKYRVFLQRAQLGVAEIQLHGTDRVLKYQLHRRPVKRIELGGGDTAELVHFPPGRRSGNGDAIFEEIVNQGYQDFYGRVLHFEPGNAVLRPCSQIEVDHHLRVGGRFELLEKRPSRGGEFFPMHMQYYKKHLQYCQQQNLLRL